MDPFRKDFPGPKAVLSPAGLAPAVGRLGSSLAPETGHPGGLKSSGRFEEEQGNWCGFRHGCLEGLVCSCWLRGPGPTVWGEHRLDAGREGVCVCLVGLGVCH